jgi:hypothetical protein
MIIVGYIIGVLVSLFLGFRLGQAHTTVQLLTKGKITIEEKDEYGKTTMSWKVEK